MLIQRYQSSTCRFTPQFFAVAQVGLGQPEARTQNLFQVSEIGQSPKYLGSYPLLSQALQQCAESEVEQPGIEGTL